MTKLTPQHSADLEQPITLKELYDAITTIKKGKTPGPDGLSSEFYLTFYQDIKHLLLDALNYTYSHTDHVTTTQRFTRALLPYVLKKETQPISKTIGQYHC